MILKFINSNGGSGLITFLTLYTCVLGMITSIGINLVRKEKAIVNYLTPILIFSFVMISALFFYF